MANDNEVCNRKRKHEQHHNCSIPNIVPLSVEKGEVTIGRLVDMTVRLQCSHIPSMISRKHATIVHNRLKRKWFIKDHKSCNGIYLNGKRIEQDKWSEVKVKDQLCFGTPISNNAFRYILKQLSDDDYQLVQEEYIVEEQLSGGNKRKARSSDVPQTESVDSEKSKEPSVNPVDSSSTNENSRSNEMLLSMQEELVCVICQELFVKAHTLSCSHSYCMQCITDWLKSNKHCPICRKRIEGNPVHSIVLDNAIRKLVECLPEDEKKERTELLKERSSAKVPKKDAVILISDSPVRSSGVVTRSAGRVIIDSDSDSSSDLSSSLEDEPSASYDEDGYNEDGYNEDGYNEDGYNGLPGHNWGGYGTCYRCGDPCHWAPGCPN